MAKRIQKLNKSLLRELPYYNYRGSLILGHGQFNNLLDSELPTKRTLEKLPSLYDLDIFKMNSDRDIPSDILSSQRIFVVIFPHIA